MHQFVSNGLFVQVISGIVVAFFLLMPLAFKWEIRLKVAASGAVVFGVLSGIVSYTIDGFAATEIFARLALQISSVFMMALIAATLMFFRDPERALAQDVSVIVSPADGIVLYVKRIENGEVPLSTKKGRSFRIDELVRAGTLSDGAYLVGIGMNLLNVHVNRAPIEGTVALVHPVQGSFLSLKKNDAVLRNERCTTVIENGIYKVGVVQIASRLVRRIESYVDEGQHIDKGERIGMIRFGSQVDVVLPAHDALNIVVRPGDTVKAGESAIARLNIELCCICRKTNNGLHPGNFRREQRQGNARQTA